MEILVEGQRDKSLRRYKFTCEECDCVFVADRKEYTVRPDGRKALREGRVKNG
ncbi:MAG: hypothetical protein ACK5JF_05275 [Oscillospiraceae bacterium]